MDVWDEPERVQLKVGKKIIISPGNYIYLNNVKDEKSRIDDFIVYKDGPATKYYKCDKKVLKAYNNDIMAYYCLDKDKWVEKGMCIGCKYLKEVNRS